MLYSNCQRSAMVVACAQKWSRYLLSRHWKALMVLVSTRQHARFSKRVKIIGWLAAVMVRALDCLPRPRRALLNERNVSCLQVPGASVAITIGWLTPILLSAVEGSEHAHGLASNSINWGFILVHGPLMVTLDSAAALPLTSRCLPGHHCASMVRGLPRVVLPLLPREQDFLLLLHLARGPPYSRSLCLPGRDRAQGGY
jgi:hypothetical protein